MNEKEFLSHHGLRRNPFADEDAQTDAVFKGFCIDTTLHPSWSKVYGDPKEPATAIVFGPKGSGKTAMKLQVAKHLKEYNLENPTERVFVIPYDDFNAYLGPIQDHLPHRYRDKPDKVLGSIHVWDHIDAILCEGVTQLTDRMLEKDPGSNAEDRLISQTDVDRLDRGQRRDALLLAACYDQSKTGSFRDRWTNLRKRLRFTNLPTWYDFVGGLLWSALSVAISYWIISREALSAQNCLWVIPLIFLVGWIPCLIRLVRCSRMASDVCHFVRVGRRDWWALTKVLMQFPMSELAGQSMPAADRSDDRYALLEKFQLLLRSLGYPGLVVIVDRVDEPDLILGNAERMQKLVWPMLDNKFLKHPGLGLKLLLPSELQRSIDRENREFHERARLDKQNVVSAVDWTGEALYDLVAARMNACASDSSMATPRELFDAEIPERRLISAMQSLSTPRALFRFLYRVIANHCKQYRSSEAEYKINSETFESTLAVFQSELARTES
jgi:hypothetical protein